MKDDSSAKDETAKNSTPKENPDTGNNDAPKDSTTPCQQPFQTLQFLVRDFQFESKEQRNESEMQKYLDSFLSTEEADLKKFRNTKRIVR